MSEVGALQFDLSPPGDRELRELAADLSKEERHVLLEHGTEAPFCGAFLGEKREGVYTCRLCGLPLFNGGAGSGESEIRRWLLEKDLVEAIIALPAEIFFRTGIGFDQDRAQRRLTDLNLKWFNEADPPPGGWAVLRMLEKERVPEPRIEKVKPTSGEIVINGTPIHKLEPLRRIYEQEYTLLGRLKKMVGLSKAVTDDELDQWQALVYNSCTLCGRCSAVCPVGNDIVYMVRKFREGMSASGHAPAGIKDAVTRTVTGDFVGPLTVGAGQSVLITSARVVGPVTVNPGGSLSVVGSSITRGVTANAPAFLSICGTSISGPSPNQALGVSNSPVPVRVGNPPTGYPGNSFAGV